MSEGNTVEVKVTHQTSAHQCNQFPAALNPESARALVLHGFTVPGSLERLHVSLCLLGH